jgi:L-threonine kinase
VQGTIEGRNILITCPIDNYSEVTVELDADETVAQYNEGRRKTWLAARKTLQHFQQEQRSLRIAVSSLIPIGKGMASSSADIGAACRAVATCLQKEISLPQIADIALSIEPTDAVFFPGIIMFDHRTGKICEYLGQPPVIEILVFDVGGEVDTVGFNARPDLVEKNRSKEHIITEAVALIKEGIKTGNLALIGQAATLSALANQTILPKKHLEEVINLAHRLGALGVNIAHSGTVVGILLDPLSTVSRPSLISEISRRCRSWKYLQVARLIGGGMEIVSVQKSVISNQ